MGKQENTISVGRQGMDRDTHPSLLQETQYSIAFNTNYGDESGNGFPVLLQNEHSNILCSKFKEGFKVIGFKNDINEDRTYYFLTNPDTGCSEIGFISNIQNLKSTGDIPPDCNCDFKITLNRPLEKQTQSEHCEYETIISDECNKCLNFDICFPIKEGNIQIKDEKCGKTLYWTDNHNPPRHLNLDNLDEYTFTGDASCGEEVVPTCLACDKLRIFPLFSKPCICPVSIEHGGSLTQGTREFLIAYSDKSGNELSQYFSITNPVSIFDEQNIIRDQTENNGLTNLAIRLEIKHEDTRFDYYKVAVIVREGLNGATSYYEEGVHAISDNVVLYFSEDGKQRTTLNKLLALKPVYKTSEIMTSSNGYLFQAGLTAEKEYNLQPVVNLMGSFLRWQTVKAHEDLYKDGVNCSLYKGYMRDEVYPFSIRFLTDEGFETANFVLINRPPTFNELEVVDNKDTQSIAAYDANCTDNNRNRRWQYYNTASKLPQYCESDIDNTESVDLSCDPAPFEMGKFSYWESAETYPDNIELYNSEDLKINSDSIPVSIKIEFEGYFTEGVNPDGTYRLVGDNSPTGKYSTDFRCKPIRHYKFPCFCTSPFMDTTDIGKFNNSHIYPIGVHISEEVVNYFLDVAVENELITPEQRSKINRYEIFRGDRTLNRGVVAKGLAYDMYKYDESENDTDIFYPNFPYNDLEVDDLHHTDETREDLIPHPFGGLSNNRYTFHSPDTSFYKPLLPTETKIEAYQCGYSAGRFNEVEGHSKWVILSNLAFVTATALAVTEAMLELAIQYGDFQVQNAIAGDTSTQFAGEINEEGTFTTGVGGFVTGFVAPAIGGVDAGVAGRIDADTTNTQDWDDLGYQTTNDDALTTVDKLLIYAQWISQTGSKILQYRHEWLKIMKENGQPENFAYYYTSEGFYNFAVCDVTQGEKLRGLCGKKYLKPGRIKVEESGVSTGDATKINNFNRESSVYLSFGEDFNLVYPDFYLNKDTSRFISSDVDNNNNNFLNLNLGIQNENDEDLSNFNYTGRSSEVFSPIASPYMSLKNYLPNQYQSIGSIKWIPTGYCGILDISANDPNNCSRIFGGDIFISRFSFKRKIPLFLSTAVGLADLTPFNYYPYRNIGHTRFYADYDTTDSNTIINPSGNAFFDTIIALTTAVVGFGFLTQPFPDTRSFYNFDDFSTNGFYVRPPSKFYLYYYGIPQFLVESEVNCNFRYARKELHEDFYPHVGDYVDWTQEQNVSIRHDNTYYYNNVYSKNTTMVGSRILPDTFDKELYDCFYDAPNGVIYSEQDVSEQDISDPWLVYKPLNFYQFPTSAGKLKDLRDIESSQILGRFENQVILFNAIDTLRDRLTPNNQELGTGGIFNTRPLEFKSTDLGYAGTQHKTMVSSEFGHFWADAKRGQVFQVDQNGRNLTEITRGLRNWFKEHLPFKSLQCIKGLTDDYIDNNFAGLGLTMGWDSRFKRVFLTKLDYVPLYEEICFNPDDKKFYIDTTLVEGLNGQFVCPEGFELNSETCKCVQDSECSDKVLDVHFVLDVTGSMGPELDVMVNNIVTIAQEVVANYMDYRFSLTLVFGEGAADPTFIAVTPQSQNLLDLQAGLQGVVAMGGLGSPEPTDVAISNIMNGTMPNFDSNNLNYIITITDALPSGGDDRYTAVDIGNMSVLANTAQSLGVNTVSIVTKANPSAIQAYSQFAQDSGGEFLNVTDPETELSGTLEDVFNDIDCGEEVDAVFEETIEVKLTDSKFFCDASFTVGYSPLTQSWISYYSYKPNYYVPHHNYFQTGKNFSADSSELGLWSHLLTNKSYQVFYGKKYGWLIELPIKERYVNKTLESVNYWMDTRRYHNEYDFAEHRRVGFNKAWIYNHSNNSGLLNLVPERSNDISQRLDYPVINKYSTDILATENDHKWSFNYFFNRTKNELNNVPIWNYDINQIDKIINRKAINYNDCWNDRLRGDFFLIRFAQDKETRFKFIFKWLNGKELLYNG